MRGVGFDFDEPAYDLTDVVLSKNTFCCNYAEKGYSYRIEATSKDGLVYRGNWGYPDLSGVLTLELRRFDSADKEILLLGQWVNGEDNLVGAWLFRLNK